MRKFIIWSWKIFISNSILYLSSFLKLNIILGSKAAFFSAINISGPLIGYYGSNWLSVSVYLLRIAVVLGISGVSSIMRFNFYLPSLAGALFWRRDNVVIRIGVPILCMLLFIVHPVGSQVWFYALYWFIPLIIAFMPISYLPLEALGSTFTQHAVGSVLWLYIVPSTPELWYSLLPIVILERLMFASGMVLCVKIVQAVFLWFNNIYFVSTYTIK